MQELALYGLVLVAALGESTAFVGLLVPGVGVLLGASVLAARGQGSLAWIGAGASLGAVVGFGLSYHVGRLGGRRAARWGARSRGALDRARHLLERYGAWGIFWGHFFGPVRAFVAFAAGAGGLPPRPFWIASVLGGVAWGYGLTAAGALLSGGWSVVEMRLGRGSVFVALVVALLYLALRVAVGTLELGLRLLPSATRPALAFLESSQARRAALGSDAPPLAPWVRRRLSPDHATGLLLSVGALACTGFAWLFFGVVEDLLFRDPLVQVDQRVFHLFQALRSPAGDRLFLGLTYLASGPVLASAAAVAAGALAAVGRRFESLLLAVGFGTGEALVWVLKQSLGRPRPAPLLPLVAEVGGAFPSNHSFSSLALYGMLAYLAGRDVASAPARGRLYAASGVLVLAVGLSRIYLGAHWLSDVLGGYALGGIWLTALVTAAEAHRRFASGALAPARRRQWLAVVAVAGALLTAWSVVATRRLPVDLSRAPETSPGRLLPLEAVSGEVLALAKHPIETLLGEPKGTPHLALAGSEGAVLAAAEAGAWREPEPLRAGGAILLRLLRAFRGEPDPLAPPYPFFWNSHPQELALVHSAGAGRWVARLWRSGAEVQGVGDLWIAWVRFEPPMQRFLGIPLPSVGPGIEIPDAPLQTALEASGRFRPLEGQTGPAVLVAKPRTAQGIP
ncbi:MAG: phosphatase PAP2 family protein [Deltaproteobacteria bacterium]|nr:phosphatase PAP2 family protein [Deltaproteobacteria bacterium]